MDSECCSICLDTHLHTITLNCNHTFGEECIGSWLQNHNTCPLCRSIVPKIYFIVNKSNIIIDIRNENTNVNVIINNQTITIDSIDPITILNINGDIIFTTNQ